jgi:uncharacterized protein YcgL (UPF0745 family)
MKAWTGSEQKTAQLLDVYFNRKQEKIWIFENAIHDFSQCPGENINQKYGDPDKFPVRTE